MKPNIERRRKYDSPHIQKQRDAIESKLAAIPRLDDQVCNLLSAEGFADIFLQLRPLYPTQVEAYERLEDFHINITGQRRYAEFSSFRKVLHRRMKSYHEQFNNQTNGNDTNEPA